MYLSDISRYSALLVARVVQYRIESSTSAEITMTSYEECEQVGIAQIAFS